jgi:predicted dehydrogenase
MSGVELVAVADPAPEARLKAHAQLDVPAIGDWRTLRGEVDIVSVCSPASTHAEIVRGFLETGAHVLVEKPIATTLDEAEDLIALAARHGRILTVGHQERFVFAKSGLLDFDDAPIAIEGVRAGPWTGRSTDVGVALDLMIHDLDLVHCLVPGALVDVRAGARAERGDFADEMTAELRFAGGTEVRLFASRIAQNRARSMRLVYSDGEIEIDFLARRLVNTTGRPLGMLDLDDPLGEAVASFVSAVKKGADALVRPEEARRALETALLIEDAALAETTPLRAGYAARDVALIA